MFDYVTIANLALNHIGEADEIAAPGETGKAATAIRKAWRPSILFVLSEANWSFALRTVALTARAADAAWPVALERTAFILPGDLVRLTEIIEPELELDDPELGDRYSIECGPNGTELQVEEDGPITIRYVRSGADVEDPARWTPAFVKAFQFYLAWQIADALAAKQSRKDRAIAAYADAIRLAKRVNNKTKAPKGNATTEWSRSRVIGQSRVPNV